MGEGALCFCFLPEQGNEGAARRDEENSFVKANLLVVAEDEGVTDALLIAGVGIELLESVRQSPVHPLLLDKLSESPR